MPSRSEYSTSSSGRSSQSAQPPEIAHKLQSVGHTVPVFREEASSTQRPPARYPSALVSTTSELDFLVDTSEAPPAYTEEPLSMEKIANTQSTSSSTSARRKQPSRRAPASYVTVSDSGSDSDVGKKMKKAQKKADKRVKKKKKSKSEKEIPLSPRASNAVDYLPSTHGVDNQRNNTATRGMSADQANNYRVKRNRSKMSAPMPPSPSMPPAAMYGYQYYPMYSPMDIPYEGSIMPGYGYQASEAASGPRNASRKTSRKPQRRSTDPSSSSTNSSSDDSDSSGSSSDSDEEDLKMGKEAAKKAYKQSMAVRHSLQPMHPFPYHAMPGIPMHGGSLPFPSLALPEQISANVDARLRRALGNM